MVLMMIGGSSAFASAGGEEHGMSKIADVLFSIPLPGGYSLPFSNSMVMMVLGVALISLVVWLSTRRMSIVPGKLQNAVEYFFETLYNFVQSVLGPYLTKKYFWYFGTIFTIILITNYMGLLPGVGIITYESASGAVPVFRGANADMNVTLFLGLFYAIAWFYWCINEQGLKGFFLHLFGPQGNVTGFLRVILVPMFVFVGLIECVSIAIRPIALAARLYGNIFAGENIIETMAANDNVLIGALSVFPFMVMELLIGFIQALVFLLLTAVFLKLQVGDGSHGHGDNDHAEEDKAIEPKQLQEHA